ncbi:MAG: hypothetical protein KDA24_04720 [Deltaproteobacteria bacterium]|nr:hypothetical protein [Deltaproteobacteria bacterium]
MQRAFAIVATIALGGLPGCPSETPEPAGPPEPEDVWLGDPLQGTSEVLIEGAVTFAELLPGWRIVAGVDGRLLELGPLDVEPTDHGDAAGTLLAAEPLADGGALIAGSRGLFTLQPWGLAPSPLGDVWSPIGATQLLSAPSDDGLDLWLADQTGLSLWRDGNLFAITAGDLPTAGAQIAWGSPVQGYGALWVAAGDVVYALVEQGDGFVTWEEGGELDPVALEVDGVDDLWTILSGGGDPDWGVAGDVRRRLPDGTWQWFRLPAQPRALVSGPSANVWLRSEEEQPRLWHQLLDTWADVQIDGASPVSAEDTLVGTDPAGRLLVAGPTGLRRISLDRPVVFLDLEDGQALQEPTTVTVLPTLAAEAAGVTVRLDGSAVEVTPVELGDRTAWSLSLDPVDLSDGAHELVVTASWSDGVDPVEQALFFSVGAFDPPTWGEDIESLNLDFCARCHTPNGGAHLLDTRARWEDEVDLILQNVISGAMPISGDKLDSDEIRLIELWRAGGFPE